MDIAEIVNTKIKDLLNLNSHLVTEINSFTSETQDIITQIKESEDKYSKKNIEGINRLKKMSALTFMMDSEMTSNIRVINEYYGIAKLLNLELTLGVKDLEAINFNSSNVSQKFIFDENKVKFLDQSIEDALDERIKMSETSDNKNAIDNILSNGKGN